MTKNNDDFRAGMLRAAEMARDEFKRAPEAAKGHDCVYMGGYEDACDHLSVVIAQAAVIDCVRVAGSQPDWQYHIALLLPDDAVEDQALLKIYQVVEHELCSLQSQLERLRLDLNSTRESYQELEEEYSKRVTEVEHLRAENEELRARLNDPCLVAGYHVCGGVHKAGDPWKDFRTRATQLCNDKAAGYRQGAEGNLARETWIDRAEVAENLATELENL